MSVFYYSRQFLVTVKITIDIIVKCAKFPTFNTTYSYIDAYTLS